MAIWDKVKQGIEKAGKAAQEAFDEGKTRIDDDCEPVEGRILKHDRIDARLLSHNSKQKLINKTEALCESALTLFKTEKYAHQFYRARFIVIGNGK